MNRRLLLPGLMLVHAAVLLPILLNPVVAVESSRDSAITVSELRDMAAVPVAAFEPKFSAVAVTVEAPQFEIAEGAAAPMAPAAVVSGNGCGLSDSVQIALRGSASVRSALGLVPADARSVADAMLLWDGKWIEAATIGGAGALSPIRQAVADAVLAAAPDCRDATVSGPRLVYVATAGGTRVLAFGSGNWRWSQLLADGSAAAAPVAEITAGGSATVGTMNA